MSDLSNDYQLVDGARIATQFVGETLPAPPNWVIERSPAPRMFQHITWHSALEGFPEPRFRDTCLEYVRGWPDNFVQGENLVIASPYSAMGKSWAAAATLHEIIRNYATVQDLSTVWISTQRDLPWMLKARSLDKLTFEGLWKKLNVAKLVVLDDILRIQDFPDVRWFLESVFSRRVYDNLPTIVTLTANLKEDWKAVTPILGQSMTSMLYETTNFKACI